MKERGRESDSRTDRNRRSGAAKETSVGNSCSCLCPSFVTGFLGLAGESKEPRRPRGEGVRRGRGGKEYTGARQRATQEDRSDIRGSRRREGVRGAMGAGEG